MERPRKKEEGRPVTGDPSFLLTIFLLYFPSKFKSSRECGPCFNSTAATRIGGSSLAQLAFQVCPGAPRQDQCSERCSGLLERDVLCLHYAANSHFPWEMKWRHSPAETRAEQDPQAPSSTSQQASLTMS